MKSTLPDRCVRWTAVAAVLAVAGVAALISFRHAVDVVTVHEEPGLVGHLYQVVIDGLIVAASMVLLDAARHREAAPRLAWWMLAAGIGATLAVNVLAGVASGPLGAVIAAWPALAFVGCYELLMLLVRAAAKRAADPGEVAAGTAPLPAPAEAPVSVRESASAVEPAQSLPAAPGAAPGHAPEHTSEHTSEAHSAEVTPDVPEHTPECAPKHTTARAPHAPRARKSTQKKPKAIDPARHYAGMLDAGELPSARRVARELHVGQPRAALIREQLAATIRPELAIVGGDQ